MTKKLMDCNWMTNLWTTNGTEWIRYRNDWTTNGGGQEVLGLYTVCIHGVYNLLEFYFWEVCTFILYTNLEYEQSAGSMYVLIHISRYRICMLWKCNNVICLDSAIGYSIVSLELLSSNYVICLESSKPSAQGPCNWLSRDPRALRCLCHHPDNYCTCMVPTHMPIFFL